MATSDPSRLRTVRALVLAVCGLLLLSAGDARADEYLETNTGRSGFALGFGVGPGLFAAAGDYGNLLGVGVATTLRIGTSAGPRSLWLLQFDSVAYLAEDEVSDPGEEAETHTNIHSMVTLNMQYYVRDVAWCKGGAGIASLAERQERGSETKNLSSGFGVLASCGFDAYRRYSLALDVESSLGMGIYSDGVIWQFGLMMALNWY